jgi:predicted nucleic acid-binding protein
MIVVSDTSPLNYLILIGQASLLEELYERVMIPQAVWAELQDAAAPIAVQKWIANLPGWVEIREVPDPDITLRLDAGEQEAITLAERVKADLILIDEHSGREAAKSRGLAVTGTLGVLEAAAAKGLIDLAASLARLKQTTFRAPATLLEEMLERDAQRGQE